jgi:hypothetical protein
MQMSYVCKHAGVLIFLYLICRGRVAKNDGVFQGETTAARVSVCENMCVFICKCNVCVETEMGVFPH